MENFSQQQQQQQRTLDRFELDFIVKFKDTLLKIPSPDEALLLLKKYEEKSGMNSIPSIVELSIGNEKKKIVIYEIRSEATIDSIDRENIVDVSVRQNYVFIISKSISNKPAILILRSNVVGAEKIRERISRFLFQTFQSQKSESPSRPQSSHPTPTSRPANGISPPKEHFQSENILGNEIYLVNRCFEEVENFIVNLKNRMEEYKRVKKRIQNKKWKTDKKTESILNLLSLRAPLPSKEEFTECFKMIKYTLNLLSILNSSNQVHNPNPVDSVHSLFHILDVVMNASRDPKNQEPKIARLVISPLLNQNTVDFLDLCLDSNETSLWRYLGPAWTISRENWRGAFVLPYVPVFSEFINFDLSRNRSRNSHAIVASAADRIQSPITALRSNSVMINPPSQAVSQTILPFQNPQPNHLSRNHSDLIHKNGNGYPRKSLDQDNSRKPSYVIQREISVSLSEKGPWTSRQQLLVDDAMKNGLRMCQALRHRIAQSQLELCLHKGEMLILLDGRFDFWKVRNCLNEIGLVPSWAVKERVAYE